MNLYLDYLYASLNLYGILTFDDFKMIFNHYGNNFNDDTFKKALELANKEQLISLNLDKELVTMNYYDLGNEIDLNFILAIKTDQGNYNYYLPEKSEFLNYSDFLYIEEKDSFNNLKKFLILENIIDENSKLDLDEIIDSYYYSDGLIRDPNEYLTYLDSLGFIFKDEIVLTEFLELLDSTTLDKRLFALKGHTTNEIFLMNEK